MVNIEEKVVHTCVHQANAAYEKLWQKFIFAVTWTLQKCKKHSVMLRYTQHLLHMNCVHLLHLEFLHLFASELICTGQWFLPSVLKVYCINNLQTFGLFETLVLTNSYYH